MTLRKDKILEILNNSPTRLRETYFINNYSEIHDTIISFINNIDGIGTISFPEKIWYWVNDLNKPFTCKCGKRTTFNKNWLDGYRRSCSAKCAQTDKETKEKRKKTTIDKYGVDNIAKLDSIKEKTENTNMERYGTKSTFQNQEVRDKWSNTIMEKYGVDHYFKTDIFKDKRENYFLTNYGKINYTQTEEYLEKTIKTNNEKYGTDWFTQTEEYKEQSIKTNNEKYGTDWFTQSEEYKEKTIKTNNEKYGTDWFTQSDDFKEKSSKTNIERYGVQYYAQTEEYNKRIKILNNIKYGVDWYYQTDDFKEKSKDTNLTRYGVTHHSKSFLFKEKVINTSQEKYGVDNYSKTLQSKEKSLFTNINKYGVDNIHKSEDFRKDKYSVANDVNYIKYISDSNSLFNCDCGKEHEFVINIDNYIKRTQVGNPICTICYPIGDQKSIMEKELYLFIKDIYSGEVVHSYRDGIEIDIYIPDMNLGFEFNGLYWHSDKYKDKNYHINKTNYFKDKGIRIVHIWEDDWTFKRSIIESQITNLLNSTKNTIYGRKCYIKEIDSKISSNFLNNNHIQGRVNSCLRLGLFHNDELVSVMTFDHFEGRNKMLDTEWNLNRFCNLINTNVVGGASKLFKHFVKNYSPKKVISYADKDWSIGDLYYTLGFNLVHESLPDYKYLVNGIRVHKSRYKKSKTNTTLTETQYALENDLFKVYDCGKIKFIIEL